MTSTTNAELNRRALFALSSLAFARTLLAGTGIPRSIQGQFREDSGTLRSRPLISRIRHIFRLEGQHMPVSRSLVTVTVWLVVSAAIVMIASAKFNLAEACAPPPADGSIADPPEEESGARRARKPQTAGERAKYISIQGTVLGDDGRPARWSRVWLPG